MLQGLIKVHGKFVSKIKSYQKSVLPTYKHINVNVCMLLMVFIILVGYMPLEIKIKRHERQECIFNSLTMMNCIYIVGPSA